MKLSVSYNFLHPSVTFRLFDYNYLSPALYSQTFSFSILSRGEWSSLVDMQNNT
jgi:hypothetical protein